MDYSDNKVKQAAEVVQSFVAVNKMIIKFTQQNAASLGLTVAQMGVLNTLFSCPGITLKEVSEKIFSPKSTISITVDGLVNLGLVVRESSQEDRREVNLKLTARGEELAATSCHNALSYRAMVAALNNISEADIQSLVRIHKELLLYLQDVKFPSISSLC
jgi:DNA-binding MarR family transcriptional regulator